jgi:hypothetical protein
VTASDLAPCPSSLPPPVLVTRPSLLFLERSRHALACLARRLFP